MVPSAVNAQQRPKRRIWIWLRRLVLAIVLLVVIAVSAALIIQAMTSARAIRCYPPPGQMVDVGGYRLHLQISGSGNPTVVLDSGAGFYSLCWFALEPEVAKFTRVVTYDRAGLGWSERGPAKRTSEQMVQELHTLLTRAKIPGPYVLVGHSLGGFNVRLFAHEYPSLVAGMVLVDSSHERYFEKFPEERKAFEDLVPLLKLAPVLAPLGAGRLFFEPGTVLPPESRPIDNALRLRTSYWVAGSGEMLGIETSMLQMKGWTLPSDLPLAVLSASVVDDPSMTDKEKALFIKGWTELQVELAAQSENSFHFVVPNSSHGMPVEEPAVVVDSIRRVVEAVRTQTELTVPRQ